MCGRISFAPSDKKIRKLFPQLNKQERLKFSYNIAPSQHTYIIKDIENPEPSYCLWGLIPSWAKDSKRNGLNFNARVEGILSKPTFRVPFRKRNNSVWQGNLNTNHPRHQHRTAAERLRH